MSDKILYFDCFSGISGDMTVGALLSLGCDGKALKDGIGSLGLEESVELRWQYVSRTGVTAVKFDVELKDLRHEHDHHHRFYRDIVSLIERSELVDGAKRRALSIFAKIAEAEATVHGVPVAEVQFHEVGAVDSIVDVVGVALLLELVAPDRIYSSPVTLGSGRVKTMHGIYPVPAPATLHLLKGAPVEAGDLPEELTTPTGAGILAACVTDWGTMPAMKVTAVGYGAGSKVFPKRPNALRLVLGSGAESAGHAHHHEHHHPDEL